MFEESTCQSACLTTSFTIPLPKDTVKDSHAEINHIFSRKKNASTQPHNYPINLFFFSVSKNVVYF